MEFLDRLLEKLFDEALRVERLEVFDAFAEA
ncbi:MAG: hypothetical protein JWR15_306, partial [Prosthecobacter sp.]|nr:hypothetical protein [Prosthecobacter sp.]